MSTTVALVLTIIAVVFSALFSGIEIAYVQSNKIRMQIEGSRGGLVDRIITGFSRNEDMFISSLLVGNNVVLVVYGITLSVLINPFLERCFPSSEALVLISNTVFSTRHPALRRVHPQDGLPHQSQFHDADVCPSALCDLSDTLSGFETDITHHQGADGAFRHKGKQGGCLSHHSRAARRLSRGVASFHPAGGDGG